MGLGGKESEERGKRATSVYIKPDDESLKGDERTHMNIALSTIRDGQDHPPPLLLAEA